MNKCPVIVFKNYLISPFSHLVIVSILFIVIVKCNNLGRVILGFLSNIIHKIITVFYFKILTLYVVDNTQKRQ